MNFAPSSAVNRAAFWVSRFPSSPVTRAASRFSHVKPQLTAISPAPIKFYLCNPVYVHRGAPLRATADLTPAEKVGSVVANLFPFWTFLFSGLAIWRPSLLSWFTGPVIVYALGATMLAMGLTLKVDDFKVSSQPAERGAIPQRLGG